MSYNLNRKFVFVFLICVILGSFGLGTWFGKSQVVCKVCPPESLDFSLFWEVWQKLQDKYVDNEKFNEKEMIYGAISGMVESLGDPYTIFMKPEDSKRFIEDVRGSFEGVGMEIDVRKGQLQVVAPLEGTPAQRAGLRAGDKILQINGTSSADMTLEEAVRLIRGPKGTEVTLTVLRKDWEEPKDFKIVREVIVVPSLKLEFKGDDIAYLRLYQFSEQAAFDFRESAIKILDKGTVKRIILDLRDNPGGYLEVAQDIAGWFLEMGQIVAIEDFGEAEEQKLYKAQGNSSLLSYPVVVLINKGSASGSEILAGALRDNRKSLLIGEVSFGKGSVQELEKLEEGSSLKITVAKWLTPLGYSISEKGLEPDIEVEFTEEDYTAERDPQLEKAIELIKNLQ